MPLYTTKGGSVINVGNTPRETRSAEAAGWVLTPNAPTSSTTPTPAKAGVAGATGGKAAASTTTPAPAPTSTPAPVPPGTPTGKETGASSVAYPLTSNPALGLGAKSAADYLVNPTGQGDPANFEAQLFDKYAKEAAPLISKTEEVFNAQIQTEKELGAEQKGGAGAALVAAGLGGSTLAAGAMGAASKLTDDKINELVARRGQAVETILSNIRKDAETNAPTLAKNAIDTVKTLSSNFVSWQQFKSAFPEDYKTIVDSMGGDNAAAALYTIQAPQATVVQSYNQGSHYVQITKDPITGAIHSSSFDLGFTPPPNWTFQKVGTQGLLAYDPATFNPNDPSTYYYKDATGGVQGATATANLNLKQAMLTSRYATTVNNITRQLFPTPTSNPLNLYSNALNYTTKLNEAYKLSTDESNPNKGPSDLELADAAIKINNGGQQITEAQFDAFNKSLGKLGEANLGWDKFKAAMQGGNLLLTQGQRDAIYKLAQQNVKAQEKNAINATKVIKERAIRAGVPENNLSTPEDIMSLSAVPEATASIQDASLNSGASTGIDNGDGTITTSSGEVIQITD